MSTDDIEAKREEKRNKRGSPHWLNTKLKQIEGLAGEDARAIAVNSWGKHVWQNPFAAGFEGASAVEQIYDLARIARKIKDPAASSKVTKILSSGDDELIKKTLIWANDDRIQTALKTQTLTEEQICSLARPFCTSENPTGHLKVRRKLRRDAKQGTALLNLHLGLVGRGGHQYATPFEIELRNQQKARWRAFGEQVTLTRGGEEISLLDVMKSTGKKKAAEVYRFLKGLESHAKAAGMDWAFVTLTAPPRMHPNPKNGHSTWDGTTPDQAHAWIQDTYHRTEARLRKLGIIIAGARFSECHDDTCPHWHMLIFAYPDDMPKIEAEFRKQPEWKSEAGLDWQRNNGEASAASYCFPYVLKTISSVEQASGGAAAVDAWRSTWGIRAFQFFGIPKRQLWRDLRAVKECPAEPLLAGLWHAAHRGDAHAFIGLAGGLNVKSKDRPVISKTTGDTKTKSIEFVLQETSESIRFDFPKWQREKANKPESRASSRVEVILNYPRKAEAEAETIADAPQEAACPPARGEQGDNPLDPDKGHAASFAAAFPLSIPFSPPVGRAQNQNTGTGALVGALLPIPFWGMDVDFSKAPSLEKFNKTRTETSKVDYSIFDSPPAAKRDSDREYSYERDPNKHLYPNKYLFFQANKKRDLSQYQ